MEREKRKFRNRTSFLRGKVGLDLGEMVMLPQEMRRYSIIAVKNKGRDAWIVNYAVKDIAGGRLRWKRKQNMFWNLEKAQAFLQEHKREQLNNSLTFLAGDRLLHCDVLSPVIAS